MNGKEHFGNRTPESAPRLMSVTADEMLLVTGGGFWGNLWDGLKSAAGWAYDHILVDLPNRIFGFKGTF